LVDLVFGLGTRLDQWMPFMNATRCTHHSILATSACIHVRYRNPDITGAQVTFVYAHSLSVSSHKEWFIVVPLFATSTIVWTICHAGMLLVYASLTARLRTASRSTPLGTADALKQTLAATGVR